MCIKTSQNVQEDCGFMVLEISVHIIRLSSSRNLLDLKTFFDEALKKNLSNFRELLLVKGSLFLLCLLILD